MNEHTKAIFLSYAREDIDVARRIADSLRASGIEVWFDQAELRGGDAWDAKIRQQIRECALFVPIISANTQQRLEGYFRLEWKLAAQRTHTMAEAKPFLLPLVIDTTEESDAQVPAEFRAVQWTPLNAGENGEEFCRRVRALLEGPRAPAASRSHRHSSVGKPLPLPAPPVQPATKLARPLVFMAMLAAAVALVLWRPWRKTEGSIMPAVAKPSLSETRQLIAKARGLFEETDDLNRENYFLAEDILKRAVALDVTDAEAWAAHAQLSVEFYRYGFDRTAARIEAMRTQAERALRLSPDSVHAQVAIAEASDYLGLDQAATAATLRVLSEKVPNNWHVLRALGRKLGRAGKIDEAQTALARADELAENNPGLWADAAAYFVAAGRYAEAEIATAKSLARRSNLRALVYQAILQLCWHGDKTAAMAAVESWPTWAYIEDRGCALSGLVWLWCRQPEKALAIYQRMPCDYLHDQFFTGPRAALSAIAHAQAGHLEAARADWQLTVQIADRELATSPGDPLALYWKAWGLARLGDKTAAGPILQQLEQRNWMPPSYFAPEAKAAGLALAAGRTDDAYRYLERDITGPGAGQAAVFRNAFVNFRLTRAVLELNPLFDELRKDVRFQNMIDRAPAPRGTTFSTSVPETKSVAVLAFENRSSEKDSEYFSDGISDELLNLLGRVPGLIVKGRTSSFSFKGKSATPSEIGRALGVTHLVEGSVQRVGTRARIEAKLIRTQTGEVVWSDKFNTDLKDIFAAQDDIAAKIATSLSLTLSATGRATKAVNPEAHRLVLHARHFWNQRSDEGFTRAKELFRQALALEPGFSEAHAGLALVHVTSANQRYWEGLRDIAGDMAGARGHAQRALELDPANADARATIGYSFVLQNDLPGARRTYEAALRLTPNSANLRAWYGEALSCSGDIVGGAREYEKSLELDPLNTIVLSVYASELGRAQQPERTLAIARSVLELRPDFLPIRGIMAREYTRLGQRSEAIAAARYVLNNPHAKPRWGSDAQAVWALREAGERDEAEQAVSAAVHRYPAGSYMHGFLLAAAGRFEDALPMLREIPVIQARGLYYDHIWDQWRAEPRFLELIAKLGRSEEYKTARATLARLREQARDKK